MNTFNVGLLLDWRNLRDVCSREGCHTSMLRYPLAGKRAGTRLGQQWYCSDECFRQAVELRIRQLQETAPHKSPRRQNRLPLGLLLLSRGCITHAQLQQATEQQRREGVSLGDVLCGMNFTTEYEVASAAATQWGCPVFRQKPNLREIQARIPSELLQLYAMAPVHYAAPLNKLLVGFVQGIEHHVLHTIEEITGCLTEPCVITSSQCRVSIRELATWSNGVTFDRISSASEMASIVTSYASQIGSEEARLGMCRDYLWVRLNRGGFPTDLLFSIRPEQPTEEKFGRS
jgi:hypothetical protein